MSAETEAIIVAGNRARAAGSGYFDNPYLKAAALPAATGEPVEVWALKERAWSFGWEMENAVRSLGTQNLAP